MTALHVDVPVAGLSAATASPRQRGAGIALMLTSSASNQVGAALGASAFPAIGPVGVVAVRQLVTASVLAPIVRPRLRGLRADQWRPVLALALVFSVMNLSLYEAVDRIGLALAVVLKFLGPLTVAIAGSRRVLDAGCAVLAGVGVVVLTGPGSTRDLVGIALALVAAGCWGCYILLNRALGQRLPGIGGTATAAVVTAAAWLPVATVWFWWHPPTAGALALAACCGLLSSIVPYVSDLLALRRVPATLFGTFTSINPVWAALAGLVVLHQALGPIEWIGLVLIVASNAAVSIGGFVRSGRTRKHQHQRQHQDQDQDQHRRRDRGVASRDARPAPGTGGAVGTSQSAAGRGCGPHVDGAFGGAGHHGLGTTAVPGIRWPASRRGGRRMRPAAGRDTDRGALRVERPAPDQRRRRHRPR